MPNQGQRTPIARTLNQFAERKVRGAIALEGKALPAQVVSRTGSIVTVKFLLASTVGYTLPNVTVPIAGPQWGQAPTQIGDKGVVMTADAYLGGVSGLGGGSADLNPRGNLSMLVFFPVGNSGWGPPDNPNAWLIYGPDGAILRDSNSKSVLTVAPAGITGVSQQEVVWQVGTNSIMVTAAGIVLNGPIFMNGIVSGAEGSSVVNFGNATLLTTGPAQVGSVASQGDVVAGPISVQNHLHSGVQPGGSNTGPAQG